MGGMGVRKRLIAVGIACLAGIGGLLFVYRGPTLAQRLEKEISQRLPDGASEADVRRWMTTTQPAESGTFPSDESSPIIIERAGLKKTDSQHFIQAIYWEKHWVFDVEVRVYFFFDQNGVLVKHWIYERENAF